MSDFSEKLKEALANSDINKAEYGLLPRRDDVILYEYPEKTLDGFPNIEKLWGRLNIIRKNLKIVSRYLSGNKGETLRQWAEKNGEQGISKVVLDKIGSHNDETGGISAYFLNLQNFYDQEESIYDDCEQQMLMPPEMAGNIGNMKAARAEKRKIRRKIRNLKLKDMKRDGNGFLVLETKQEEPVPALEMAADGKTDEKPASLSSEKKEEVKIPEEAKNKLSAAGKVIIGIAGATIVIGIGVAIYNVTSNKG